MRLRTLRTLRTRLAALLVIVAAVGTTHAFQSPQAPPLNGAQLPPPSSTPNTMAAPSATTAAYRGSPDYVLGPNDEILVSAVGIPEVAGKTVRVSPAGDVNLNLVGSMHVVGLTVSQFQADLVKKLLVYYKNPDVVVNVTGFKSQPVTVVGAVGSPGEVQLEGRKTLIEVLAKVGYLIPEASSNITIQRLRSNGPLPIEGTSEAQGPYYLGKINVRKVLDGVNPQENIEILPNDIINVPRSKLVYAMGEVKQPGGFALDDTETISVLQLLARAQGRTPTASSKGARILRPVPNAPRVEIEIDLKDIEQGKAKDVTLQPEDILFVPDSYAKGTLRKTLDTVIQAATGVIIYR